MQNIGIVESKGGHITRELALILARHCETGKNCGEDYDVKVIYTPGTKFDSVMLESSGDTSRLSGSEYDLLVLSASAILRGSARCRQLLVPGTLAAAAAEHVKAERIVTYGLSRKDSITMSSLGGRECMAAVQREFNALDGSRVEVQEIGMHLRRGISVDDALAITAAELILFGK